MATLLERIRAAWATGDPPAMHREVEQLASEGQTPQALESALETLLLEVRKAVADDEAEEVINGVWDRVTGWCHASRRIETRSGQESGTEASPQVNGELAGGPGSIPSTTP